MDKITNLLSNNISYQFIHLLHDKSILRSYGNRPLRRDLYLSFKSNFISFVADLTSKPDGLSILTSIDDISNNEVPDFNLYLKKNGGFYSRNEINLEFLKSKSKKSLLNLKINNNPSLKGLLSHYEEAFLRNEIPFDQLNWDFLLIFRTYFGKTELTELIELYLDIIIDEKEFDGIQIIENLIFNETYDPKYYFLKRSLFVFHKALDCIRFLDTKLNIKEILDKMYQYMDDHFDTNTNTNPIPYSTENIAIEIYEDEDKGVIQKKDRLLLFDLYSSKLPNWSFSNLTQVNNAYRLNLIDEARYQKGLKRFTNYLDTEIKIKNFEFLNLNSDANIPEQNICTENAHYPNTYFFNELDILQKSEYKTAFSNKGTKHNIQKYCTYRIQRLLNAFYSNVISITSITKEMQFLSQFHTKDKIDRELENITAYAYLKNNGLIDKIEKIKVLIHNIGSDGNKGLCILFNEKYYRFYCELEYKEAIKLPEEVIEIAYNGGNISEENYYQWNNQYNNYEVSHRASNLNDKIRSGAYEGLVSSKKTDAPILANLLEKDYEEFMVFFKEKLGQKQYSHFIDPLISRLMSAYMAMKEYGRAISLAEEFLTIKTEYTELYLTPEAENILKKREKSLQKIIINYLSFAEAKKFIGSLNLKSRDEWVKYKKLETKPENIPANPENVYLNKGWKGFQDFLGYETVKRNTHNFLPFEEAKVLVHSLKLCSESEWTNFKQSGLKPDTIPAIPEKVYKEKGWKGFKDFLGYETVKRNSFNFLPYEDAKVFVHSLKLCSESEWRKFKQSGLKPDTIPAKPENVYKEKGWKGFKDFLGYEKVKTNTHNFLPFEDAKVLVHSLKLCSEGEWTNFKQSGLKPDTIPAIPEKVYKEKGWKGFKDFLGYETVKRNSFNFLPYEDAKVFVHSLKLCSESEWRKFKQSGLKPDTIPAKPEEVYKGKGWKGFKDWLGY